MAAEISPSEAIRCGARGCFGGPGPRGGPGHHGEKIKTSHVWYPQPSVSSHGGVAHWAGGRQPRGSGQLRLSVGECWVAMMGPTLPIKVGSMGSVVRFLTLTVSGSPPPDSSMASSCAMHPVALRTPSSWTTCAHHFCLTCGGNYPGMFWTPLGPHLHLP